MLKIEVEFDVKDFFVGLMSNVPGRAKKTVFYEVREYGGGGVSIVCDNIIIDKRGISGFEFFGKLMRTINGVLESNIFSGNAVSYKRISDIPDMYKIHEVISFQKKNDRLVIKTESQNEKHQLCFISGEYEFEVSFVQAMEEILRGNRELVELMEQSIQMAVDNEYMTQQEMDEVMEEDVCWTLKALGEKWEEYKKENGITEEDVKRIEKEEEEKFKKKFPFS